MGLFYTATYISRKKKKLLPTAIQAKIGFFSIPCGESLQTDRYTNINATYIEQNHH